jgi:hypothetical protein
VVFGDLGNDTIVKFEPLVLDCRSYETVVVARVDGAAVDENRMQVVQLFVLLRKLPFLNKFRQVQSFRKLAERINLFGDALSREAKPI